MIGNSVTSIGDWAFAYSTSLTSITLGTNVTSIGQGAFTDCESLSRVTIPNNVVSIGQDAFSFCRSLTSVTIGNNITNIGSWAFSHCTNNLTGIYFKGNAPGVGSSVFLYDKNTTVYYLPGTTNWGTTFSGRPAVLWNPQAQTSDGSFGVQTNQFGFNITGTANIPIVLEACTDLASPVWVPLLNCTLTNGSVYFSDPDWANYPNRFYRFRSP
jgi:hypothetical protein